MSDVAMPRLSDSMEEGTILKWLKSDGDEVSKGEELVEIETDKANMTYEADEAGTFSIVAEEGDTLAVGETIAKIGEGGGEATQEDSGDEDESDEEPRRTSPTSAQDEEPEAEEPTRTTKTSPRPKRKSPKPRSPRTRAARTAASRPRRSRAGWRASSVSISPPSRAPAPAGGSSSPTSRRPRRATRSPRSEAERRRRTSRAEERKPARDGEAGRGEVTQQELTRLQRTVARRMAESKATAPDFVMTLEVDMEEAVEFRKQLKVAAGDAPAPSFNDFVIKASALALRDFPRANGAYRDGQFELYSRINIGVAVAGQDALVVPTVFDADKKSLGTIAAEARRLAERVREGKITPPELSSGTFTISNLGMYGIRRFVAVINPPQAAILAVGELSPRPVVRDGEIVIRAVMELTLTCDHRILYGADAAEFLAKIREYLEQPLRLAL